ISNANSQENVLFEDVAIFGTGRKGFVGGSVNSSAPAGSWVCRRCWVRWEGATYGSNRDISYDYDSYGFRCESCLVTHSGESMPYSYTNTADGFAYSHYEAAIAGHIRDDRGQCHNAEFLGSIFYLKSTDRAVIFPGGVGMLVVADPDGVPGDCFRARHMVLVAHPSVQNGAGTS